MFGQESSCVQFPCILWKELRDKSGYHTLSLETRLNSPRLSGQLRAAVNLMKTHSVDVDNSLQDLTIKP